MLADDRASQLARWLVGGRPPEEALADRESDLLPLTLPVVARALERDFETEDTDTALHSRLALADTVAVQDRADPLLAALTAQRGIQRLLLFGAGEIDRLPQRAGHLVAIARPDYAAVMNYTTALNRFAAEIDGGRIPDLITRCRLLGRKVSRDLIDLDFSWYGEDARLVIANRAGELFRRVVLCFLHLALQPQEDGSARLALKRKDIIALADKAAGENARAAGAQERLQESASRLLAG